MGGATILFTGFAPAKLAAGRPKSTCKGVTYLTPAYRALRHGVDGFIERLTRNAPSDIQVQFFDSGTLMGADAQMPELKKGTIQFMFQATTYISKAFPILGITGLPGVCDQLHEHGERLAMESPLWKLINNALAKDNLFMLTVGGGVTEPEYVWSREMRITDMDDLRGRRCRVVGHEAARFMEQAGATVVRIPSSQTYLALQRKSVDSALLAINTVMARNLQEQLHYCFKLPVTSVGMAVFLLKDKWDQMPSGARDAFWRAGRWYDDQQGRTGYKQIPREQYWPVIKKAGIQVSVPSAEDQDRFTRRTRPIWAWWKARVGEAVGSQAIALAQGDL